MANPQLKNGYIRIATGIWEALCKIRISGEARQVLDVIIRKTYGFQKKEDTVSLSQFALATGLKQPTAAKALRKLISMNLITKKDNGKIGLQKNFDLWKPLPKKITVTQKDNEATQKDNKPLPKKVHTIDKHIDTNTIDNTYIRRFDEIWAKYPKGIGKKAAWRHFRATVTTLEAWDNINKALCNYLSSERVRKKIIQDGSTWFNNWADWLNYKEERHVDFSKTGLGADSEEIKKYE